MDSRNRQLKKKTPGVLPTGYRPELDTSQYLTDEDAVYYQQQIGVLRWAVEIGRIDIACAVSMLTAFNAAPRAGHLEAVFHIFAYLQSHSRTKNVMDCNEWKLHYELLMKKIGVISTQMLRMYYHPTCQPHGVKQYK